MMAVSTITPHLSSIKAPEFLAKKAIWVIWRFEDHGETKPRKVPYYANGAKRYGVQGRLEDRQQLVTFEAARTAAAKRGFTGIGHACLDGDFTVIDFDRCAIGGTLDASIEALASTTYAEYSPSGEGIHLYALGNINQNLKSIATAEQFGIELFSTKGFVTFTGNSLEIVDLLGNQDTIDAPSSELSALIAKRFGKPRDEIADVDQAALGLVSAQIQEALSVLDPDMGHADWLKVGMALHHETSGNGFDLWDAWSRKGTKYPGDGNLQGRWDSFGRNPGKQVTAKSLVQMANENGARINISAVSLEGFENLTAPLGVKTRFPVTNWRDFAVQTSHQYVIKSVIPKATLGVLYGESGAGKSFITLDLCIAIARGLPWRNLRTTQGRVVYIVAEGASGFRNRLIAYAKHYNLTDTDIPLDIIDATPNLLRKDDAQDICKSILASGVPPSLVVIDTLAQAMAGANENTSEDMGTALAHCKGIHTATGAMVLLVHHSGKDSSKGARGWSGMRAAADVELEVTRTMQGRALRTTKQKDGADFQEWGFDLEIVPVGEDQDGDVITSCVVIEAAVPVRGSGRKIGKNEQVILNVMSELALVQSAGIEAKEVIKLAVEFMPPPEDGKRDSRAVMARNALKNLCKEGYFVAEDDGSLTIL